MLHKFLEPGDWFRPKTFGYGAGLPIAWQGWVLLGLHVGVIVGLMLAFQNQPKVLIPLALVAALLPMPIYAARTQGGWRWRSGKD